MFSQLVWSINAKVGEAFVEEMGDDGQDDVPVPLQHQPIAAFFSRDSSI
jgi:hypothetical protein